MPSVIHAYIVCLTSWLSFYSLIHSIHSSFSWSSPSQFWHARHMNHSGISAFLQSHNTSIPPQGGMSCSFYQTNLHSCQLEFSHFLLWHTTWFHTRISITSFQMLPHNFYHMQSLRKFHSRIKWLVPSAASTDITFLFNQQCPIYPHTFHSLVESMQLVYWCPLCKWYIYQPQYWNLIYSTVLTSECSCGSKWWFVWKVASS